MRWLGFYLLVTLCVVAYSRPLSEHSSEILNVIKDITNSEKFVSENEDDDTNEDEDEDEEVGSARDDIANVTTTTANKTETVKDTSSATSSEDSVPIGQRLTSEQKIEQKTSADETSRKSDDSTTSEDSAKPTSENNENVKGAEVNATTTSAAASSKYDKSTDHNNKAASTEAKKEVKTKSEIAENDDEEEEEDENDASEEEEGSGATEDEKEDAEYESASPDSAASVAAETSRIDDKKGDAKKEKKVNAVKAKNLKNGADENKDDEDKVKMFFISPFEKEQKTTRQVLTYPATNHGSSINHQWGPSHIWNSEYPYFAYGYSWGCGNHMNGNNGGHGHGIKKSKMGKKKSKAHAKSDLLCRDYMLLPAMTPAAIRSVEENNKKKEEKAATRQTVVSKDVACSDDDRACTQRQVIGNMAGGSLFGDGMGGLGMGFPGIAGIHTGVSGYNLAGGLGHNGGHGRGTGHHGEAGLNGGLGNFGAGMAGMPGFGSGHGAGPGVGMMGNFFVAQQQQQQTATDEQVGSGRAKIPKKLDAERKTAVKHGKRKAKKKFIVANNGENGEFGEGVDQVGYGNRIGAVPMGYVGGPGLNALNNNGLDGSLRFSQNSLMSGNVMGQDSLVGAGQFAPGGLMAPAGMGGGMMGPGGVVSPSLLGGANAGVNGLNAGFQGMNLNGDGAGVDGLERAAPGDLGDGLNAGLNPAIGARPGFTPNPPTENTPEAVPSVVGIGVGEQPSSLEGHGYVNPEFGTNSANLHAGTQGLGMFGNAAVPAANGFARPGLGDDEIADNGGRFYGENSGEYQPDPTAPNVGDGVGRPYFPGQEAEMGDGYGPPIMGPPIKSAYGLSNMMQGFMNTPYGAMKYGYGGAIGNGGTVDLGGIHSQNFAYKSKIKKKKSKKQTKAHVRQDIAMPDEQAMMDVTKQRQLIGSLGASTLFSDNVGGMGLGHPGVPGMSSGISGIPGEYGGNGGFAHGWEGHGTGLHPHGYNNYAGDGEGHHEGGGYGEGFGDSGHEGNYGHQTFNPNAEQEYQKEQEMGHKRGMIYQPLDRSIEHLSTGQLTAAEPVDIPAQDAMKYIHGLDNVDRAPFDARSIMHDDVMGSRYAPLDSRYRPHHVHVGVGTPGVKVEVETSKSDIPSSKVDKPLTEDDIASKDHFMQSDKLSTKSDVPLTKTTDTVSSVTSVHVSAQKMSEIKKLVHEVSASLKRTNKKLKELKKSHTPKGGDKRQITPAYTPVVAEPVGVPPIRYPVPAADRYPLGAGYIWPSANYGHSHGGHISWSKSNTPKTTQAKDEEEKKEKGEKKKKAGKKHHVGKEEHKEKEHKEKQPQRKQHKKSEHTGKHRRSVSSKGKKEKTGSKRQYLEHPMGMPQTRGYNANMPVYGLGMGFPVRQNFAGRGSYPGSLGSRFGHHFSGHLMRGIGGFHGGYGSGLGGGHQMVIHNPVHMMAYPGATGSFSGGDGYGREMGGMMSGGLQSMHGLGGLQRGGDPFSEGHRGSLANAFYASGHSGMNSMTAMDNPLQGMRGDPFLGAPREGQHEQTGQEFMGASAGIGFDHTGGMSGVGGGLGASLGGSLGGLGGGYGGEGHAARLAGFSRFPGFSDFSRGADGRGDLQGHALRMDAGMGGAGIQGIGHTLNIPTAQGVPGGNMALNAMGGGPGDMSSLATIQGNGLPGMDQGAGAMMPMSAADQGPPPGYSQTGGADAFGQHQAAAMEAMRQSDPGQPGGDQGYFPIGGQEMAAGGASMTPDARSSMFMSREQGMGSYGADLRAMDFPGASKKSEVPKLKKHKSSSKNKE